MTHLHRIALCCLLSWSSGATASGVEIPLRIPFEAIRQALSARLGTSPAKPTEIFREGRCRYLNLDAAKLEASDGHFRLSGPGSAAMGVELFGNCQNALAWQGSMEFTLAPRIDRAGRLRLHILDSKLTDTAGGRAAGFIWELSKRYVHPRLERFSYDLGASRAALASLLQSAAPPEQAAAMEQALSQFQVLEPRIERTQVVVPIALEVPDAWLAAPPAAATSTAPLTEAEVEALENALQPWDAFLVQSIRQVALDSADSALHKRLFTLLLESRYQLTAILAGDAPTTGDPVRGLFIETWNELHTILADAQRDGVLDASLLRYAAFIDAGDALAALGRAAPGMDMRLSADGLRQLARSLRPGAAGDPLAYDWEVDPQLRRLFEVDEGPDPEPSPPPPTKSWLDLFISRAYAGDSAAEPALDRWVPATDELPSYEARIGSLLQKTSASELQRADFAAPYDKIYQSLVPTTALIESCWRQYVRHAGKASYLRSPAGSVGIMQINQHVWRGFYDVQRLRWDTAYNMRVGAQILARYMKDYAIPYARQSGDPNHAPRAAYAVYNAGPRAVGRFSKAEPHPREARVDERLWTLYQGIAAGGHADLGHCAVKPAKSAQLTAPGR